MITFNLVMLIIALCMLIAYEAIIFTLFGVPSSYSDTHYLLSDRYKFGRFVFPLFLTLFAFVVSIVWYSIVSGFAVLIPAFALLGMEAVAVSPYFKEAVCAYDNKWKRKLYQAFNGQGLIHTLGAFIVFTAGLVWIIFTSNWVVPCFTLVFIVSFALITRSIRDSLIFHFERFLFYTITILLIIGLFI